MINYDRLFSPLFEKSSGIETVIFYTGLCILANHVFRDDLE